MVDRISLANLTDILSIKRCESSMANSFSMPLTREAVEWLFTRSTHYAGVKDITVPEICGFRLDSDYGITLICNRHSPLLYGFQRSQNEGTDLSIFIQGKRVYFD
jgi:hypothetical protein